MNSVVDAVPNISVITKIEVLGFTTSNQHYKVLSDFTSDATILDLTNIVVEYTNTQYELSITNYELKIANCRCFIMSGINQK